LPPGACRSGSAERRAPVQPRRGRHDGHATLNGRIIVIEVPDEPMSAGPSLESLAGAVQVIAERVDIDKVEAKTLIRQPRSPAPPGIPTGRKPDSGA